MPDRRVLSTESGAPVADNQNSQTAGPGPGPATGPAPRREAGQVQPGTDPGASRARPGLGRLRVFRGDP